jgi:pimeloyl-ACP methyl ester carboxylesterase
MPATIPSSMAAEQRTAFGELKGKKIVAKTNYLSALPAGRAYYGGNALRLGTGALTLLTLIALAGWLLRRRARETAPVAPEPEEGAEHLPTPFKSPEGEAEFMAAYEATLKLWPVPYEPMDIPGRYGRTHLVASGSEDGPTLVLLHMFFTSLTQWAANIADLSRDYRVYAIDVTGQPTKSIPSQPLKSRQDCVTWLSELLDALNIESTDLVGASFGGWFTLNYALGAPKRLNKIVLLSPAGGFLPLVKQFYVRGMLNTLFPRRFMMESFLRWMTYEENLRDPSTRLIMNCLTDQMYLGNRYFRQPAEMTNFIPSVLQDPFSDEELRGMQVPTLLLIGQQEALYDSAAALERARRLIPNIEGELIAQANHEMTISKHEIVDPRVLEFLKRSA